MTTTISRLYNNYGDAALHRLKLSWKKAKKLLGRADPERRQAFIEQPPERAHRRPTRSAPASLPG